MFRFRFSPFRFLTPLAFLLLAGAAHAQTALDKTGAAQPTPAAATKPVAPAEPPPPPEIIPFDPELEPQVTIRRNDTETVEEYRVNGQLYMLKVTPAGGIPYYLVDPNGNGQFTPVEPVDKPISVPRWVIFSF
ncbi:MAG: DUF2782 domain-containing protein [Betaproteobacteria bacterium]|nr:DUF2782 domain-containing protein [Betaproteobacteria bacterium]